MTIVSNIGQELERGVERCGISILCWSLPLLCVCAIRGLWHLLVYWGITSSRSLIRELGRSGMGMIKQTTLLVRKEHDCEGGSLYLYC
jgi:hypothetical protein